MDKMTLTDIISRAIHEEWKEEKEYEGYHPPEKCPNFENNDEEDVMSVRKDLIHCNKCLANLIEYDGLSDFQKEAYLKKAANLIAIFEKKGININLTK